MASKPRTGCSTMPSRPVMVRRPLGDPVEVTQLELAADDPAALAQAIRNRLHPSPV
jgi:hypothetical protein